MAMNHKQHMEGRKREEGADHQHMRGDSSVPIMGSKAASIHGAHTGEGHPTHGGFLPANSRKGMMTPAQGAGPKAKKGKRGDHEENS